MGHSLDRWKLHRWISSVSWRLLPEIWPRCTPRGWTRSQWTLFLGNSDKAPQTQQWCRPYHLKEQGKDDSREYMTVYKDGTQHAQHAIYIPMVYSWKKQTQGSHHESIHVLSPVSYHWAMITNQHPDQVTLMRNNSKTMNTGIDCPKPRS